MLQRFLARCQGQHTEWNILETAPQGHGGAEGVSGNWLWVWSGVKCVGKDVMNFEIWNLKFLKSEIWNFEIRKLKISTKKNEFFRTNFFRRLIFSNRSKDKWPAGHGATFIFRALSGQCNWGRSFSRKSKNLTEIPVWGDLTRIGFWKCVTLANFNFGRPNLVWHHQWLSKSSKLSTWQLHGQW